MIIMDDAIKQLEATIVGGSLESFVLPNRSALAVSDAHLAGRQLTAVVVEEGVKVYHNYLGGVSKPEHISVYSVNGCSDADVRVGMAGAGVGNPSAHPVLPLSGEVALAILSQLPASGDASARYAQPRRFTDPKPLWIRKTFEDAAGYVCVSLKYD